MNKLGLMTEAHSTALKLMEENKPKMLESIISNIDDDDKLQEKTNKALDLVLELCIKSVIAGFNLGIIECTQDELKEVFINSTEE